MRACDVRQDLSLQFRRRSGCSGQDQKQTISVTNYQVGLENNISVPLTEEQVEK